MCIRDSVYLPKRHACVFDDEELKNCGGGGRLPVLCVAHARCGDGVGVVGVSHVTAVGVLKL